MNEKITEIKELMNARQMIEAKKKIDDLDKDLGKLDNLQEFKSEIMEVIKKYEK